MITNPKTVTIASLRELGACETALDFLSNRFGDSITIVEENVLACADGISWTWALLYLLNHDQRILYKEAYDLHRKAHDEACAKLREAYTEACKEACEQRLKACEEARDTLWESFNNACAKAFVTAYYTD